MKGCCYLKDLIIIGGGPAGLTAGIYAARAALDAVLIERGAPGGQVATTETIENYPGFPEGISGTEIASKMHRQLENLGMEIIFANANRVQPDNDHYIVETDTENIKAKTIILATGAEPSKLNVAGEDALRGRGVSYCATCDGAFFRGRTVGVIGGGDAAIEEAIFLTKLVEKVYVVHRRGELRAAKLIQKRAMDNPKIEFLWHSVLERIQGNDLVEAVVIKDVRNGETTNVAVDGVFIYVGVKPNSDILQGLVKMNDKGYILCDERMHTSSPGIFAAGDVRLKPLRQVVTAVADGAVAVESALRYIEENA
ncbi:MAG: thioredoxin-disulfide reductase [Desulfotomaculaceae bacterium]